MSGEPLDPVVVGAYLAPHHHELARAAASFAATALRPLPAAQDDVGARRQSREILGLLGEAGFLGHAVPQAFGGCAAGPPDLPDLRACCVLREVLAAASPLADSVFALQGLGSLPLTLAGGEAIRRRYLPGIVSGQVMAAFALTEPEAGTDAAGVRTRAVRDGDHYVLDGGKHLITNAGVADYYVVFASTDPAAGSRGLTALVVPADTPGFTFVRAQVLSEPHPLGEIAFEGCRVPVSHRLGAEGEGFKLAMRTLDRLRATVAAAACGMAARALEEALAHAQERRQFGQPLADFQLIQQKLARMATELTAARLLTFRAAAAADGGAERVTQEAAMAKMYATEAAQRIVDDAVQIVGGRGVLMSHPVDRLYRAVRALRIYEGTTEIQHLVIARGLLQ